MRGKISGNAKAVLQQRIRKSETQWHRNGWKEKKMVRSEGKARGMNEKEKDVEEILTK